MKDVTIIVCIKPVPDPECPASSLEINGETRQIATIGVPPVINPYDENALEAALKIKDATGARVIAVTMVERSPGGVLHKARTGADELFVLQDERFKHLDSFSTAFVLAAAIRKIGKADLVFTGRQATDWSAGLVGSILSEMLRMPCVAVVKAVTIKGGQVIMERLRKKGSEIVRTTLPAVATVSSEIGDLRLFPLKAINEARKKPMTVWSMADLGISPDEVGARRIVKLSPPASRKRDCHFIDGQLQEEKGEALALRLRQDRII